MITLRRCFFFPSLLVVVLVLWALASFEKYLKNTGIKDDVAKTEQHQRRHLQQAETKNSNNAKQNQQRPVMHTFYHSILNAGKAITVESSKELLTEWKRAWWKAGWDVRILTVDDAMQFHAYDSLMDLIVDPTSLGDYNTMCYVRWIAMAAVGGGWMCDYDTFPLNDFVRDGWTLPNNGRMTLYDRIIPDLVSGTADEYFRIVKLIGASIHKHIHMAKYEGRDGQKEYIWGDMPSLQEMHGQDKTAFLYRFDVLPGEWALSATLSGTKWGPNECEVTRGKRAVHLSHFAMTEWNRNEADRAMLARQWLDMWDVTCPKTPVEEV